MLAAFFMEAKAPQPNPLPEGEGAVLCRFGNLLRRGSVLLQRERGYFVSSGKGSHDVDQSPLPPGEG